MKRWAWATAAAFAGTVSAVGQTPPAVPAAASSTPAKGGDVVVIRTAGQPDRQLRILKVTSYGDGESIADVQDVASGAKYSIPAKVLAAMARTSGKPALTPVPAPAVVPKANPTEKIPALPSATPTAVIPSPAAVAKPTPAPAAAPLNQTGTASSPRVYATPDANDADVVVIRTAGQPDRRVKVIRLANATDGESIADVQDMATGAKYVIPSKVLATLMRAAPRTPNLVGTQPVATAQATPINPPVRPKAPLADPATGWPRASGPVAPSAPLATTTHAAFRTSLPVPPPPLGSHTPFQQVPLTTPNDAPKPRLASASAVPPFAVPSPRAVPMPSPVLPASATTIQLPPPVVTTAAPAIQLPPPVEPTPATAIQLPTPVELTPTVQPPSPIIPTPVAVVQPTPSMVPSPTAGDLPPSPIQVVEPVASASPPTASASASSVRGPAEMRSVSGRPASTVTAPSTVPVRPVVARRKVASFVRSLADSSFWTARFAAPATPLFTPVGRPLAAVRPALPMVSVPADWPSTVEKIAASAPAKVVVAAKPSPVKADVILASYQQPAEVETAPVTPVVAVVMPRPIASALTSRIATTEPLPLAHLQPGTLEYRVVDRMDEDLQGSLSDLRTALRPATRQSAATAIAQGRYGWKPEVKAHLAQAARADSSSIVRAHCIELLSKLGYHETEYLDFLDEAVTTASPEVQTAAKAALLKLAPK